MTPREQAAFDAGIEAVPPMALLLPPAPDPILAAIATAEAARDAHQAIFDGELDEDDDEQMARLDVLRSADRAAFKALAEVIPTTHDGGVALAEFYLRDLDDVTGLATSPMRHLRDVLAGGVP